MTRISSVLDKSDRLMLDLAGKGLPEIPLLGVHHEKYARAGLRPHKHDAMEICYLTSGERTYSVGGRDHTFRGNELFVTYPDEIHGSGAHPHGKGLLYWMQIRLPARPAPFLSLSSREAWPLVTSLRRLEHRSFLGERSLKRIFEEALTYALEPEGGLARLEISTRIIQWLTIVLRCSERASSVRITGDVRLVLDHIGGNSVEQSSLDELAALSGLSVSRFKAKFKEQMGMPPGEYGLRQRIRRSEEMLQAGESVTGVAYALGFSSSQYFATAFKRITGRRPCDVMRRRSM